MISPRTFVGLNNKFYTMHGTYIKVIEHTLHLTDMSFTVSMFTSQRDESHILRSLIPATD